MPQSISGAFQYTGQLALAGQYNYKARDYVPQLGIFAQTDPIGYEDSPNLYAYVGDDPVNLTDPSGTIWMTFWIWHPASDWKAEANLAVFGRGWTSGFLNGAWGVTLGFLAVAAREPEPGELGLPSACLGWIPTRSWPWPLMLQG